MSDAVTERGTLAKPSRNATRLNS